MPNLTRRNILAAAFSLALPRTLGAQGTIFDFDIAIIGAGAAGLAAARECARLGRSFVLVEARQRIGGRVFTDRSLGEPFDAGAVYIHWAERNPWTEVAKSLGVETREDKGGADAFQFFDHGLPTIRNPRRRRAFEQISELLDIDAGKARDVSIADVVAPLGEEAARAGGTLARMSLGEEPERVSAMDYARLWSGDDLLVPSGYGDLVARYGADVPVRLGVAVQSVDYSGAGVVLGTAQGSFSARRAVITVPAGVLAAGGIIFNPALPVATQEGIAGLGMGNLAKIALKFDGERFGIPEGTDVFDAEGPRELFDFECF